MVVGYPDWRKNPAQLKKFIVPARDRAKVTQAQKEHDKWVQQMKRREQTLEENVSMQLDDLQLPVDLPATAAGYADVVDEIKELVTSEQTMTEEEGVFRTIADQIALESEIQKNVKIVMDQYSNGVVGGVAGVRRKYKPTYVDKKENILKRQRKHNIEWDDYAKQLSETYKATGIGAIPLVIPENAASWKSFEDNIRLAAENLVVNQHQPPTTLKEAIVISNEAALMATNEINEARELIVGPSDTNGPTDISALEKEIPGGTFWCDGEDENTFFVEVTNCS